MGYEYANARLRALKSQLFDRRQYAELLALTRFDDLVARLAQSTYAAETHDALARYLGTRVVMEACRMNLANTLRRIRDFFDSDGRRLMNVLLAGWDLFNLKTILRGHEAGVAPDLIIEALSPAGELDENALRAMVRQTDPLAVATFLSGLNPAYGWIVHAALGTLAAHHNWTTFEIALDNAFMAQRLGMLHRDAENDVVLREYLRHEIDASNVMCVLRLRREHGESAVLAGDAVLRGGNLPLAWLVSLAGAQRDEEALALLRSSPFGGALAAGDTLNLEQVQRAVDLALERKGVSYFQRDPLSIATAIGFVTAKRVEASNIRLIGQGLALGMAREEIEKELAII
jgi:V/A-type H+-transporting ATPase subunit C